MLNSIIRELIDFLSGLGLPVYQADCIPDGAPFPYLALEVTPPLTAALPGRVSITLWCRSGSSNADRIARTDALLTLLPPRGTWLETSLGAIILTPERSAEPVADKSARGLRTTWKLCFHPHS